MTTPTEAPVTVSIEGRIAVLSFNRPKSLNAFNADLVEATTEAMARLRRDDAVLAVIVRGEGRAFSAGFDLKESAARAITGAAQWRALIETDFDFIMQFWDFPKPTIAAVHGYCLAGAFELMLACDLAVAAEDALFGEPEVRFGSGIVALLLPWMTGPRLAKELLLTGNDRITARRMEQMGLLNRVVPPGQELAAARELAEAVCAASPQSVALTKRAINRSYEIAGMRQALLAAVETDITIESDESPERAEFNRIRREQGLKAAIAWRDARFRRE
jgi:enoyl-CoA hydratase